MKNSVSFKILDVEMRIDSSDAEFMRYLSSVLKDCESAGEKEPEIRSSFHWQRELLRKNPLTLKRSTDDENIGANIALSGSENRIKFLKKIHLRRLKLDFSLRDDRIYQELFCHRKTLKEFLDKIKNKTNYFHFFELTYFLLYYPLFWYLEKFRDIHPLHASCVDTPGGGVLMAGLPGSGKTVTSLALWKNKENSLVSDNIVLYDTLKVYSCPEPVRLHDSGLELVGEDRIHHLDLGLSRKSKGFYLVKEGKISVSSPKVFLLMGISDKFSLREMDSESAAGMAFSQSIQGAEILNYFDYASLLNFMDVNTNLFDLRMRGLKTLLGDMKCFRLSVPRGSDMKEISDKISALL